MKKSVEFGRTMIETISVLFIMGMLGVGAIVIYDQAMNSIRAQQIIDQVLLRAQWKLNDKERVDRFKQRLDMGTIKDEFDSYKFKISDTSIITSVTYKIVNKDNSSAQVVSNKLCRAIKSKVKDNPQFSKVLADSTTIGGSASGLTIVDCPTGVIKSVSFTVKLK